MRNAYDALKAQDPEAFPRTARTAYQFDPKEWLRVNQEADELGERIACIYHSHADVGAYFSEEDRRAATFDGAPLLPGVDYLVVAVNQARVEGAKLFRWQDGGFTEVAFDFPLPRP
jgi:proteasome lid subunit RPN8/RPN11